MEKFQKRPNLAFVSAHLIFKHSGSLLLSVFVLLVY